jgi:hypothetical protein
MPQILDALGVEEQFAADAPAFGTIVCYTCPYSCTGPRGPPKTEEGEPAGAEEEEKEPEKKEDESAPASDKPPAGTGADAGWVTDAASLLAAAGASASAKDSSSATAGRKGKGRGRGRGAGMERGDVEKSDLVSGGKRAPLFFEEFVVVQKIDDDPHMGTLLPGPSSSAHS